MPALIGQLPLPEPSPHFLKLRVAVRRYLTVNPHTAQPAVVGLSGGADSLSLVAALRAEGHPVLAVCVDHQLQEGSTGIAHTAAAAARTMGASAQVVTLSLQPGPNMEARARAARYQALAEAAQAAPAAGGNAAGIWLAHTADDNAETFLLTALRGQSGGMLPTSSRKIGTTAVTLHRPFLESRRADTAAACAEIGLKPWHDPHNTNTHYRRVALRLEGIPALAHALGGHDIIPALAQAATAAAANRASIRAAAAAALPPNTAEIDIAALTPLQPAVRHEAIAAFIRTHGGRVTHAQVRGIDNLIMRWHGQGGVAIGAGKGGERLEVIRKGGKLATALTPNQPHNRDT